MVRDAPATYNHVDNLFKRHTPYKNKYCQASNSLDSYTDGA